MSCPLDKHELYRLLEPYAKYGDDDGFYVRSKGVTALSEFLGIPFKDAMIILLEQDIWPERFRRNRGVFTSRQMARLLSLRVFIAGCGGLGGHVASLLARMGAGGFRLCDPDIFEESNLNRQYFCTERRWADRRPWSAGRVCWISHPIWRLTRAFLPLHPIICPLCWKVWTRS